MSRAHVIDDPASVLVDCGLCGRLGEIINADDSVVECPVCNGFGLVRTVEIWTCVHNMQDEVIERIGNHSLNGCLALDHGAGMAIFTAPPNISTFSDEQWIELLSDNGWLARKLREHGWLVKL